MWSADQERALSAIGAWLRAPTRPTFSLGGYAGTGKTTLARHIADTHGGVVKFAALTGKAASVLRAKGCRDATTIHSLIYVPAGEVGADEIIAIEDKIQAEALLDDPDEEKLARWREELATKNSTAMFEKRHSCEIEEADLVIIDESSMVDTTIGHDLESFGVPVLYLGDPGQLPPVRQRAHVTTHDFVLQEIHRQAADSPIIWIADRIRRGGTIEFGEHGDGAVRILPKREWSAEAVMATDQVITGRNTTRRDLTRALREWSEHRSVYPEAGEKLVCCRNDHEARLLNGVTCRARAAASKVGHVVHLQLDYEGRDATFVCDAGPFQEYTSKRVSFPRGDGIQTFDYGYVITGHKAQGSQWCHVTIADDRMRCRDSNARRKWLYSVFTRAEEKVTYYV